MSLVFAIAVTLLFVIFTVSLSARVSDSFFSEKDIKNISEQRKYVFICGLIDAVLSWFNCYLWNISSLTYPILPVILTVITILLTLFLIFMYCVAPSKKSAKNSLEYENNKKQLDSFLGRYSINKTITVNHHVFAICNENKVILLYDDLTPTHNVINYCAVPYASIIDCELIEDNATILKGGVGRSIVGAVVAGSTGAIIGAATRKTNNVTNSLSVRIITNEVLNPLYERIIIDDQIERNDEEYKIRFDKAQKIYATVLAIMNLK